MEAQLFVKNVVGNALGAKNVYIKTAEQCQNEQGLRQQREHIVLGSLTWKHKRRKKREEEGDKKSKDDAEADILIRDEHNPATYGKAAAQLDHLPEEVFVLVSSREELHGSSEGGLGRAGAEVGALVKESDGEEAEHANRPQNN